MLGVGGPSGVDSILGTVLQLLLELSAHSLWRLRGDQTFSVVPLLYKRYVTDVGIVFVHKCVIMVSCVI